MSTGSGTGTLATGLISPLVEYQSLRHFSAVWVWDNSVTTWVNRTLVAQTPVASDTFTIFEDTNDWTYLGSEDKFDLGQFDLQSAASVGTLTYQYWNGRTDSWTQFTPGEGYDYLDDFSGYNFSFSGAETFTNLRDWEARIFSTGNPHTGAPPDGRSRYWIRISSSTTSGAIVQRIRMRPYASYCRATDVANLLQLRADFDDDTIPSKSTVEDYIYRAQSRIDYRTQKSWRPNVKYNEYHEFTLPGIKLVQRDVRKILRVRIWNGGEWQVKTEGRNQDYFMIPEEGNLYWSRYFLLPARMQSYNAPVWMWGWAEFTKPVRVDYIYGRDLATDAQQGGLITDLAIKMAGIDIYNSTDYSILTVQGTDRIAMDRKVENWKIEIEEKLEELRGWQVF